MPQLIPFYFINQLSFSFLSLLALIYVISKYILPLFTYQQVIRMYITKLSNKSNTPCYSNINLYCEDITDIGLLRVIPSRPIYLRSEPVV